MPHPDVVAYVAQALTAARDEAIHFGSEAERIAHEFVVMAEAMAGREAKPTPAAREAAAQTQSTGTEQPAAQQPEEEAPAS